MKQILFYAMLILLLGSLFVGCAPTPSAESLKSADVSQAASDITSTPSGSSAAPAVSAPVGSEPVPIAATPTEAYTSFMNAKSSVLSRLKDGFSAKQNTIAELTTVGFFMVDLIMMPAEYFGSGEATATSGLALYNASYVKYSENGNTYSISYTDEQGAAYVFSGTYDAAADALVCTAQKNGKDNFYAEYRKTSYGYVSQYFFVNDDKTTTLYLFSVSGQDGAFGVSSTQAAQPAALTGSEPADFPTTLPEWYRITGSAITGKMSDGTDVSFEYVPSEE